jgi:hypothetical protein
MDDHFSNESKKARGFRLAVTLGEDHAIAQIDGEMDT